VALKKTQFIVAAISRNSKAIPAPESREELRSGDELIVLKRYGEDVHLALPRRGRLNKPAAKHKNAQESARVGQSTPMSRRSSTSTVRS
jgi:hypothetical protein